MLSIFEQIMQEACQFPTICLSKLRRNSFFRTTHYFYCVLKSIQLREEKKNKKKERKKRSTKNEKENEINKDEDTELKKDTQRKTAIAQHILNNFMIFVLSVHISIMFYQRIC